MKAYEDHTQEQQLAMGKVLYDLFAEIAVQQVKDQYDPDELDTGAEVCLLVEVVSNHNIAEVFFTYGYEHRIDFSLQIKDER